MVAQIQNRGWNGLHSISKVLYEDTYFLPKETYSEWLDRITGLYSSNDAHRIRMKSYIHNYWFHPSTPVSTSKGLPISCFTGTVPDSKVGIFKSYDESNWLGSFGGGLGWDWSQVREIGHAVGTDGGTSSGVIPFLGISDRSTLAISQGGSRRASQAVYLHVSHPEIIEFVELRTPVGDQNRRCPNLHHGIVITDSFMEAVINDLPWDLISPKSKTVVNTISARELWHKILDVRITLKGEPYLLFIDTVNEMAPEEYKAENIKVNTSNLCVTGDTKVLTKEFGYIPIDEVYGQTLECWNGNEWSKTKLVQTSEGQSVLKVKLDNYIEVEATPYHKWYVMDGYSKIVEKRTNELLEGDKLVKFDLEPVPHGDKILPLAYVNGFHSGDGTVYKDTNKPRISLHDGKQVLLPRFSGYYNTSYTKEGRILNLMYKKDVLEDKYYVPNNSVNIQDRLNWLAGYLDADGTLTNNSIGSESIQVVSTELKFLKDVLLLLQEIGIHSTISKSKEAGYTNLPTNDGTGTSKDYWCKAQYRLLIAGSELNKLLDLGFEASRVQPTRREYQRQARQFVKVMSVTDEGKVVPTYCGIEPKEHKLMFNGVLTGNCTEITLRTDEKHSGVCCLGSINLEYWDEYCDPELKIFTQFIQDCTDFLDNVLQVFIDKTENLPGFERARAGALDERSIGLGVMGDHSLLQKRHIPIESAVAKSLNIKIHKLIHDVANAHNISDKTAICPMAQRTGSTKRNIHITAIAPTMSISNLCNVTSSGIEPWLTNSFVIDLKQGSFTIQNKYLDMFIKDYATKNNLNDLWVQEQWAIIKKDKGSVLSLSWMSDYDKSVFKTAYEIDQAWLIERASDRQVYVDQAQSLNLFIPGNSHVNYIADLHILAWKKKVKSLYYLRSTAINRASADTNTRQEINVSDAECLACQ